MVSRDKKTILRHGIQTYQESFPAMEVALSFWCVYSSEIIFRNPCSLKPPLLEQTTNRLCLKTHRKFRYKNVKVFLKSSLFGL